jgi:hypothetical protein
LQCPFYHLEETAEESESEPEIEARSEADMAVIPSLIPFPGKLDLDGNIARLKSQTKSTFILSYNVDIYHLGRSVHTQEVTEIFIDS